MKAEKIVGMTPHLATLWIC